MKRKVVPLDKLVQISRATAEVSGLGKREVRISRRPGSLELEMEELKFEVQPVAEVVPIKKPRPE